MLFRLSTTALLATSAFGAAPQPVLQGPVPVQVVESAKSIILTAKTAPAPGNEKAAAVSLSLKWLGEAPKDGGFTSGFDPAKKTVTSVLDLGGTHVTRTIVATPEAVFVHFLADKPGAISFKASLRPPGSDGIPVIEDRREIAWISVGNPARKARVWVIPFESDVESDGNSVVLRGEGECLVVFTATASEIPAKPLSETWKRLCTRLDPGGDPPDPTKIWQAIAPAADAP